jgi:hypothetical protein
MLSDAVLNTHPGCCRNQRQDDSDARVAQQLHKSDEFGDPHVPQNRTNVRLMLRNRAESGLMKRSQGETICTDACLEWQVLIADADP